MIDCRKLMRDYSRYILIVFNFFFVLTGVVIISVGVSAKAYYNEFDDLLNDKYFYVSDLLIVIGAIIFIIAFFGCCGALKENACLTTTFSTLLVIIFILEALVGISGIVLRHKTEEFLEHSMNQSLSLYGNDTEITETWDLVQTQMKCCGITNYTDWFTNKYSVNHTLPVSCCPIPHGAMNIFNCSIATAYPEGCLETFGDYIRANTSSVEIAGISLALVQLVGIILSCYLAKQIRSDYETV
ncbi:CD63 antigen-like [Sitophilus oryzae]|uniref:Tetraspanin n=1 Tax=Sitophilus oryzae TaxID=7048 RepID=A0A6J2XQX5_SITOR|nr:CD63 antigen-like [Sitophilus oryzae]